MKYINETTEILDLLYKHGWDERNGGNLSLILSKEEVSYMGISDNIKRVFAYDFDLSSLIGSYILITGTGKYFKNCKNKPSENLGLLKVIDKNNLGLVWGFTDGGKPTSEAPTHLKCHIERLKVDKNHKLVIHTHPTNIICMTHIHELNENTFTLDLWKMQTESIVVFPEGIGILPWMICGGEEIGDATSAKMKEYRSVIWAQHGIFCTGTSLDEVFGLIETIEKAAEIFMKICDKKIYQSITNEELKKLAKTFNLVYKKGVID